MCGIKYKSCYLVNYLYLLLSVSFIIEVMMIIHHANGIPIMNYSINCVVLDVLMKYLVVGALSL